MYANKVVLGANLVALAVGLLVQNPTFVYLSAGSIFSLLMVRALESVENK